MNYHRKESTLDLDWGDVFVADPQMPLLYDINVGTRDGYSDVFNQDETKATSVRIFVQSSFDSVWISIKAFYVTGKGAYYRGTVYF